ncbi:hypothetical protein GKQ38_01630 [Candidatus Nanohaloarchaea archaeon]|nr:hypothetical protein GKQ38_01630 [Candidatus Nanohaloarchaea archaeon]
MAPWEDMLEDEQVEVDRGKGTIDIEAPPSFGRSEYEQMVENLWDGGRYQNLTVLDRTLDAVNEAGALVGESAEKIVETTVNGNRDREQYGLGALGILLGGGGLAATPMLASMEWGGKALENTLAAPGNTKSNNIYDTTPSIEEEAGKIFYSESSDGRYIRITGPEIGELPEEEIAEQGLDYIKNF